MFLGGGVPCTAGPRQGQGQVRRGPCTVRSNLNKFEHVRGRGRILYIKVHLPLYICHGFVSAGDALGQERPATPMSSFLAGRSGCK